MKLRIFLFLFCGFILFQSDSCTDNNTQAPKSSSGVTKATVKVPVNPVTGMTIEQQNIHDRLLMDNKPGSIKHLYVISVYSGQVLIYSTVRGKVTSSGKRLTPSSVVTNGYQGSLNGGFNIDISGQSQTTNEVLQDDGSYGSSNEYVYWWDSKNIYHQLYITGGMIVTLSDQPMTVKNVVMNFEMSDNK